VDARFQLTGIPDFEYYRPTSLADACKLGRELGADAAFIAGGTELLPDYQRERETARHLIALDGLSDLRGISVADGVLKIGALTSIAEIAASSLVRDWVPALADAAAAIGSPQIRSMATIGGNFCRAVPCADMPPAAIAVGARLRIVGPRGERTLDAAQLFSGPRQTVLARGEVLAEVLIPKQPVNSGDSYQRFARRRGSSLAVAAVAARLVLDKGFVTEARIALGAVSPVPLLVTRAATMLQGERASEELFAVASAECADAALPITDLRGSASFRRELVEVLTRRALAEAAQRAGQRRA
jgi:CO/xanthine dehydrogenase FAD-binding subunit